MPPRKAMEGSMKAVQKIRSLLHQPKPIVSAGDNPFSAPDRATLSVMREGARRYWVCPSCGYGRDLRGT
jgi:ABC-type uncharacterized transport system ATPase subunit